MCQLRRGWNGEGRYERVGVGERRKRVEEIVKDAE